MKRLFQILVLGIIGFTATAATAHDNKTITTYRVTTLRAEPGNWYALKALIEAQGPAGTHGDDQRFIPFRLRHSQGDHWDFMLIQPIDDFRIPLAATPATQADLAFKAEIAKLVGFSEEWFVNGPPLDELQKAFDGAGMFHIEMFRAKAGAHNALLQQRKNENAFLKAVGQVENEIFTSIAGADWDVMTIGFHESLKTFAAGSNASAEEEDKAARDAGFNGVGDIAPFLRNLLHSHNDTIAVAMN
ncbi:MAG: hypothetical protein PVF65_03945 [Sphingomonadales bacterium]|jgi:hypothetical protein